MHTAGIVTRILVVLGAAGAAGCGGSESSTGGSNDATTDSVAETASGDTGVTDAGADVEDTTDTNAPDVPCVRRPFLVGAKPRAAALVARDDWSTSSSEQQMPTFEGALDETTRRALVAAWREDGRQEHASIAAFARFTMWALAVGAPPEIIVGAQRAALDEVRHARGCFALAARYHENAEKMGPASISLDGAMSSLCLAELAALTVHEGCVGETLGVLLASEQLAAAKDPTVRRFLDKLVHDEMRHAELAWSFVRWAIDVGGESVRRAVDVAFDEAIDATLALTGTDVEGIDLHAWHAHGRITAAEARALVRRGVRDIVRPCRAAFDRATTRARPCLAST